MAGFVYPYLTYDPAPLSATQPGPKVVASTMLSLEVTSNMRLPIKRCAGEVHGWGRFGRGQICLPLSYLGGSAALNDTTWLKGHSDIRVPIKRHKGWRGGGPSSLLAP